MTQIQASKDSAKLSYRNNLASSESLRRYQHFHRILLRGLLKDCKKGGSIEEDNDIREARRIVNSHLDRQYTDASYRGSQGSQIPNFQRPLLRKHVAGRMSAGRRKGFDDSQLAHGETSNYVEGLASLSDALSKGLNPSYHRDARFAAFNYIRFLLQQGPKGIPEVIQSFEKVMKLFFQQMIHTIKLHRQLFQHLQI